MTPADALKRERSKAAREALAKMMAWQLHAAGLKHEREHLFHGVRKWRFDFAFPDRKLALEVDGGTWTGGRHTRGTGYEEDCRKFAEAAILGWRVIRATGDHVRSGIALQWVERALALEST